MAKRNKLVNLATSKKEEPQTNENKDEVKAKAEEKVQELLDEVDLNTHGPQNDGLIELDTDSGDSNNLEWLQEQVGKLSSDNEKLRSEAATAKNDYKKIFEELQTYKNGQGFSNNEPELVPDSMLKRSVIDLFNDIQRNFYGLNPEKTRYQNIVPSKFLMKMEKMFPFLKEHRIR